MPVWEWERMPPKFLRWFDLMGLQRHIKVLGISRGFITATASAAISRICRGSSTTRRAAAAAHPETAEFADFLASHVDAAFAAGSAVGESSQFMTARRRPSRR